MKLLFSYILLFSFQLLMANEPPKVEGIWTCSKKDCKVEIYKIDFNNLLVCLTSLELKGIIKQIEGEKYKVI